MDDLLMRSAMPALAIPAILMAIVVSAAGAGRDAAAIAARPRRRRAGADALTRWVQYARTARGAAMVERAQGLCAEPPVFIARLAGWRDGAPHLAQLRCRR
ncbi:hypothetical protein [Streptomyces canarius]